MEHFYLDAIIGATMGHWKLQAKIKGDVLHCLFSGVEAAFLTRVDRMELTTHCLIYLIACSLCTASNKQWCFEAPTVPNGVGVRLDTHPNALGKCWCNNLYKSIPKRPVYADKLIPKCPEAHCIVQDWGKMGLNFFPVI